MGKYKYGKPDEEITLEDFKRRLEKSHLPRRQKAYLIVLYWLGCRRREPLFLRREDIEEREGSLYVAITVNEVLKNRKPILLKTPPPFKRCKRGQAGGAIELPLSKYGIPLLREVWKKTRKRRKIFGFTDITGYRAAKKLYPFRSPHWFRYNRITKLRKKLGKELTIDDIKSFTGIKRDSTIQNYGMKTKAAIHKVAQHLD